MTALAVAGCDGGPKSPDFEPERTIENFVVYSEDGGTDAVPMPVGTTDQFTAEADIVVTVPPGYIPKEGETLDTRNGKQVVVLDNEDVSSEVRWTSSDDDVAGVSSGGLVTALAQGSTRITGSFAGESAAIDVTVTAATLTGGVRCVRPATTGPVDGAPCAVGGTHVRPSGLVVPFEAIGRFSDGQDRRIAAPYVLNWSSNDLAVAAKPTTGTNEPATSPSFQGGATGSAIIEGRVVSSGSNPMPVPAAQTTTLSVTAANQFCASEFLAPQAEVTEDLCLGCSVDPKEAIVDGDIETYATMQIPLGLLLLSNVSVTVASPEGSAPITAGNPVGFVLSRTTNNILAAQLLGSLEVSTVSRNDEGVLVDNEDPATSSELLRLTLLGIRLPDDPQFLLTTGATTQDYDGVKLTFRGGLLSLLAAVNVNTVCSRAQLPTTP
jgi:hypothetical protein